MPTVLRKTFWLFAIFIALTGTAAINTVTAQTKPAQTRPETTQADTDSQDTPDTADTSDDELDVAAVTLDVSHSSPLIQKLYQATSETNEQDILARLSEAKKLLAGWFEADSLSMGSAMKTIGATIRSSGYTQAPVSLLTINGRPPDLVFQKALDTFAKRHHIRIWKEPGTWQGRDVWIGAATHDIDISKARANTKWGHRIDPHVDREREWIETDLLYAGTATSYALVDRPHAPKTTSNATGDVITTDGQLSILDLGTTKPNIINPPTPVLQTRPAEGNK